MTPELEQLKITIAGHKEQIRILQEQLDTMVAACPHEVVAIGLSAICAVCNQNFGWFCPDSPDHACYYHSEPSPDNPEKRIVKLRNGQPIKLPASHRADEESDDWCIFCGQPDERK